MKKATSLLKKLPLDLGQGYFRHTTKAKKTAFSMLEDGTGKKALDIGCGDGFWSEKLKNCHWDVTAIDKDSNNYPFASAVNIEHGLPFKSGIFDLVWASEIIEHVSNTDEVITEFRRVLKPGGMMVLTTPNSFFWMFRLFSLFNVNPSQIQNPDHKHFFDYHAVRTLFPHAAILGFFPYYLVKITIKRGIGPLSPTFIIVERKD